MHVQYVVGEASFEQASHRCAVCLLGWVCQWWRGCWVCVADSVGDSKIGKDLERVQALQPQAIEIMCLTRSEHIVHMRLPSSENEQTDPLIRLAVIADTV